MSERSVVRGSILPLVAALFAGCAASTSGTTNDGGPDTASADGSTVDVRSDINDAAIDEAPIDAPLLDAFARDDSPDAPLDVERADVVTRDASDVIVTDGGAATCPGPRLGETLCAATCGNGRVDSCEVCGSCGPGGRPAPFPDVGGICCRMAAEECDGTVSTTCEALGFRGGSVRCTDRCRHDTSGCQRCATSAAVTRCAAPAAGSTVASNFGLATSSDAVAAAWISESSDGAQPPSLQFALFGPDLAPGPRSSCITVAGGSRASVAALASGWLVAYDRGVADTATSVVVLQRFDSMARPEGAPVELGRGYAPRLTRNATNGDVLVAFSGESDRFGQPLNVAMLASDGATRVAPRMVFAGTYGLDHESAVWVGDAVLIASRTFDGTLDHENVVRLERDGRETARTQPVGQNTEYAQLTFDGARVGMLYASFGGTPSMRWQWLSTSGAAMGSPVALGAALPAFGVAYPYVLGPGSYYLVRSNGAALEGLRLSGTLEPVGAPVSLGTGGSFGSNDRVILARAGASIALGFTTMDDPSRALSIALVTP